MNPEDALQLLQEGNTRFAAGAPARVADTSPEQRRLLVEGQNPFAIILGCSDSRAPVELIFDQNLGDLFVIRVAGNIVAPSLIGSVEFAAKQFGTRLVIVLGHSKCGAIQATLSELQQPSEQRSPNLDSIVNCIRPAVEPLLQSEDKNTPDLLFEKAVRANVSSSANQLRHGSAILEGLIENNDLKVIGAEYSLETGLVEFFDGV